MPPRHELPGGSSRRLPLILLVAAAALLVARVGTGIWEERNPATPVEQAGHAQRQEFVQWQPIATAAATARAQHKPIFYDFSAAWCGPCRAMSAEVFSDANGATEINSQFVPVLVVDRQREDGRNAPEVQALEDRFRVEAFPTIVVYSPETGRHETITGYGGRERMLAELSHALIQVKGPQRSQADTLE